MGSVGEQSIQEALSSVRRRFETTPRVAVAGFGNAGKSRLFNAIYGQERAAVSMRTDETREPQTEKRFGIEFTDTPGIGTGRFSLDHVSDTGLLDRQHVVIHVLNGAAAISEEDERLHDLIERSTARRVTVVNKVDLLDADERAEFTESVAERLGLFERDFLFVSAKRGTNVDRLVRQIAAVLPDAMQDAFVAQQHADLELKAMRVRALVYGKAAVCAGVALTPVPVADIVVITPIQMAMVAAIGFFYGVAVTRDRVAALTAVLGAGFGLREAARQLLKLVPGAGPVVSASIAFAGTVALGEAAKLWFEHRMKVPAEELREVFEHTARSARQEYEAHRTQAEAASTQVAALRRRHEDGDLDDDELASLLADLLQSDEPTERS